MGSLIVICGGSTANVPEYSDGEPSVITEADSIVTERFLLRPLSELDATERYLGWLSESKAREFIVAAAKTEKLADLRAYIRERVGRDDVMFLGIFDRRNGLHIGNLKYEPINSKLGYAIMGVLIGDPDYRGKGVVSEVLRASTGWLKQHRGIKEILLGVAKENKAAIKAYGKVGFVIGKTPHIKNIGSSTETMVWRL